MTESRSTKSGLGCLVPARVPQIMSCATNVRPHLGSRGGPNGRPLEALANLVGMAKNCAVLGRIFVRLPRLPMWIPAYSELNRKMATALDPPKNRPRTNFAFVVTIDFFNLPDCRRTDFEPVGPLKCCLMTICFKSLSVTFKADTFSLSIFLI